MAEVVRRKLEEKAKRKYCSCYLMVQIPTFFSTHLISMKVIFSSTSPISSSKPVGRRRISPIPRSLPPSRLANRWAEEEYLRLHVGFRAFILQRILGSTSPISSGKPVGRRRVSPIPRSLPPSRLANRWAEEEYLRFHIGFRAFILQRILGSKMATK